MTTVVGNDDPNFIQGGSFEDSLSGAGGNDTIEGFGGDDTIDGGTGNDDLWGGDGNDTIYGRDGNDRLIAGVDVIGAFNYLDGGEGNDELRGSAGNDTLFGGSGDDTLIAFDGGVDLLRGGDGNDTLTVYDRGVFSLEGGAGNDRFFVSGMVQGSVADMSGGAGVDTYMADYDPVNVNWSDSLVRSLDFQAGAGGDVIDLSNLFIWMTGLVGTDDAFDPRLGYLRLVQQGADTALQLDADGLKGAGSPWHTVLLLKGVNAAALTLADNFVNGNNLTGLTIVQGTSTAPKLAAPMADISMPAPGRIDLKVPNGTFTDADVGDQMQLTATLANGAPLPAWLSFDNRGQFFTGRPSADTPWFPLSIRVTATDAARHTVSDVFSITPATTLNDSLLGSTGNDVYDGFAGSDTIDGGSGNDRIDGNLGNDLLLGNSGTDTLLGAAGNDQLNGGTGNDSLSGGDGNDSLYGVDGNDTLSGGNGNDQLDGGGSADSMTGGAGNDRYVVQNSGDTVVEASGGGTDSVSSSITYALPGHVEKLTLTGGSAINGTGNTSSNTITGNTKANSLSGGDGNDRLFGMEANDTLSGGNGNDALDGGSGNDSLIGGTGNDTLTGGAGLDIFRFSSALSTSTNVDSLTGFNPADDILQLENSVFTKLTATGVLSASNFRASSTGNAADSNDFVLYETDTGQLFYDADGNGAGVKVLVATLTGLPVLTAADIFVT